jgi:hypothetical protein
MMSGIMIRDTQSNLHFPISRQVDFPRLFFRSSIEERPAPGARFIR